MAAMQLGRRAPVAAFPPGARTSPVLTTLLGQRAPPLRQGVVPLLLAASGVGVSLALVPLARKCPGRRRAARRVRVAGRLEDGTAAELERQPSWWGSTPSYSFPRSAPLKVGAWIGEEHVGSMRTLAGSRPCRVYHLPAFLPPDKVSEVLEYVRGSLEYLTEPDTVDGSPSFHCHPLKDGQWRDAHLQVLLDDFVRGRLLPYLRKRYTCSTLALADVLIRRYAPGERRGLGTHFDGQAMVTAVMGLNDPCEYEGGLYCQPEPHASSRMFFHSDPGDIVAHSFDLQHGVFVKEGTRYSMVFWFKDCQESAQTGAVPWYDTMAEKGDANALFNLGQAHEFGLCGKSADDIQAIRSYAASASKGHHLAQVALSKLLFQAGAMDAGSDLHDMAVGWLRKAAEAGFAEAQKKYALALFDRDESDNDCIEAAVWMGKAAEQLDPEAGFLYGRFLLDGVGLTADKREAVRWFERGAEAGHPDAQEALGTCYLEGVGVDQDLSKAADWFERAANVAR